VNPVERCPSVAGRAGQGSLGGGSEDAVCTLGGSRAAGACFQVGRSFIAGNDAFHPFGG